MHSYRYRWGYEKPDPKYDDAESFMRGLPAISTPTILLQGAEDGASRPESSEGKEAAFYRRIPENPGGRRRALRPARETGGLRRRHIGNRENEPVRMDEKSVSYICYVNGEFVAAGEAKVSAFDHGFLYGDGLFESMTVTNRRIFKFSEHLDRMERSARVLKLELPESRERIAEIIKECVRKSGSDDVYLRVVISRGAGYPLLDPRVVDKATLAVLLHDPAPPPETGSSYKAKGAGLRLKTAGVRKVPSESFEARVKSLNYLNNVMARIEAVESGFDEAILLDVRGFVAEAPGENVFVVKDGVLKNAEGAQRARRHHPKNRARDRSTGGDSGGRSRPHAL